MPPPEIPPPGKWTRDIIRGQGGFAAVITIEYEGSPAVAKVYYEYRGRLGSEGGGDAGGRVTKVGHFSRSKSAFPGNRIPEQSRFPADPTVPTVPTDPTPPTPTPPPPSLTIRLPPSYTHHFTRRKRNQFNIHIPNPNPNPNPNP